MRTNRIVGLRLCVLLLLCAVLLTACAPEELPETARRDDAIRAGVNAETETRDDFTVPTYDTVLITLNLPEHCSLISQNPLPVKRGEDAVFKVLFRDNYTFASSIDGVIFQYGCIILPQCDRDRTVSFKVKKSTEIFSFALRAPDPADGTISSTVQPGNYTVGQPITVRVSLSGNRTFLGWSSGATAVDGGAMVSFSQEYSFTLQKNTVLYPNFMVTGYTVITYDLNGGVLAADGLTSLVQTQFDNKVRLCPNLTPDIGTFVRDGYTLLEYTENADGTGQAVCPGGIAVIEDGSSPTFYAQWSKWTDAQDFSYSSDGAAVRITKYNGDADTLSIPARIDGLPVRSIAKNAVVGKRFSTLVIPSTVKAMDDGAFANCKNFDTLYITDTFTGIGDAAFSGCKNFSHLRLGAGELPHYPRNAESVATRLENIIKSDPNKPTIVLVGGSSCLYGIFSPILEDGLHLRYNVINAGTNAGGTGILYMEALAHYMKEGDLFVNVPEIGAAQMGGTALVWRTFRATEGCYNIYRYVDFSNYSQFFSAMSDFNSSTEARAGNTPQSYEIKNTSLTDFYCDLVGTANGTNTYNGKIFSIVSANANSLKSAMIATYCRLWEHLCARGIGLYFSYPPIYTFSEEYRANNPGTGFCADSNFTALWEKEVESFPFPVISDPLNYRFYEGDYYNSAYHLTAEAARERTRRLLADIAAQLSAEGRPI